MQRVSRRIQSRRNSTIDVLKGISIIFVLITHYAWTDAQRLNPTFPFLIEMAVPVFMILSGYVRAWSFHFHNIDTISEGYESRELFRKIIRYTVPFLCIVLWQVFDSNVVINATGLLELLRWFLNGTVGPGSYYYPIQIQMIFVFPVVFFIIEWKKRNGLWICLVVNAVYELLKWSYGMNDDCYRLLLFRYVFLIASGVYAFKYELRLMLSVSMTLIGGIFIFLTTYGYYTPKFITSWTSTSFVASMWIVPAVIYMLRNVTIRFKAIEIIGKASYNIFLVQMIYYYSYREQIILLVKPWSVELIVGIAICIIIGIAFYEVESRITRWILNRLSPSNV